ncbi:hypothetical protein KP509_33G044700 [Ceratopteris richardii]|uniref:Uncharacterized protein n=1 Tax=Ceratopteris richardii TaxID=49495 RepID=A0A8T2QNJ3_CERRI|nr:hypothetical protein KP509_33G044700 [Ceratopteris richardii]
MGRSPCCDKVGLKKGLWTAEEDEKLVAYIEEHGHDNWRALPKKAGLLRCGKSCRLRWTNYLRPDIKRGEFTAAEEQTIIQLHALLGNRWSAIASHLPKRTDNEIKNHWNTHLKKRLLKMGLDPVAHKLTSDSTRLSTRELDSYHDSHNNIHLKHMAQWESARLEAEARLAMESALRARGLQPSSSSLQLRSPTSETASKLAHSTGLLSVKRNNGDSSSNKNVTAPCLASVVNAMENLQNWEFSLQGQAGLMWPESWRASSGRVNAAEQGAKSIASSSAHESMSNRSPTSTLSSLNARPVQSHSYSCCSSPSASAMRLSWSDTMKHLSDNESLLHSRPCDMLPALAHVQPHDPQACNGDHENQEVHSGTSSSVERSFNADGNLGVATLEVSEGQTSAMSSTSSLLQDLELHLQDVSNPASPIDREIENYLQHHWIDLLADSLRGGGVHDSISL